MNIVILCPLTLEWVDTGVSMNKQAFAAASLEGNTVFCPHCGTLHEWNKEEARLAYVPQSLRDN